MTLPSVSVEKTLRIYLALAQYPILSTQIRAHMRRALFEHGVISQQDFEAEVREQAIHSQQREAIHDPYIEEPSDVWELRQSRLRDHLTDFYFAYNLPYELFEQIVRDTLVERGVHAHDLLVTFNPELAPQSMLFEQASAIENLPEQERSLAEPHLREIKVVLIRTLISDQLAYVNIAKDWFTIQDLRQIYHHKIGSGKIGGKAAGMLLARRILENLASPELNTHLSIPESYFLGADVTYAFMAMNNLMHWNDQKYKTEERIRAEYPQIIQDFIGGKFPPETLSELRNLLNKIGRQPLIVRSSSLLEDNFGTSFAGKYESIFCPNQDTREENLYQLTQAIQQIYASILNPDVLLYRRSKGLQDYDERMAILIQLVQGEKMGHYFLPFGAGVAFSRNQFRWNPQIRREDGFIRLVWGLGTRAVERMGNDYPRLVALSHPLLHPEATPTLISQYSQHYVDLIDLENNQLETVPVDENLSPRYPGLRYVAQIFNDGYMLPIRMVPTHSSLLGGQNSQLVITFDELLRRTSLASRFRELLNILEETYHSPVDTEFTLHIVNPNAVKPEVDICILQCRPQSQFKESKVHLPTSLNPADVVFSTSRLVPEGNISGITHVVYISPEGYFSLCTQAERVHIGHLVSKLNARLAGKTFITIGPGRWGTINPDLGVPIKYGDIYNTRSLVELSGHGISGAPEPSFGTHFFQDLVEANIYPLAIYLDDPDAQFNRSFFYDTPNHLETIMPEAHECAETIRLIKVASFRPAHHLELVMDDERGQALAYLVPDS
ncbi:MAG: PEP/pyruvate-binding domain-containing protein [Anaerolineales bacterium]